MSSGTIVRALLALGAVAAIVVFALSQGRIDVAAIEQFVKGLGIWAPIAHVALFAIGAILFAPGSVFGLAGGAVFGPLWGLLLNLSGAVLGATAAFLIARYAVSDWVRARTGTRIERVISGVEAEGWRFVALARLMPFVPFNLLNYALGLTRISLPQYVLASLVAMTPGTLAITWIGFAGRRALDGDVAAIRYGLLALAVLGAIAFVPRLIRRLRGSPEHPNWIEVDGLAEALQAKRPVTVIDVRAPADFTGSLGHIREARNVPLAEIRKRLPELEPLKSEPIVLICRTHRMSFSAAGQLADAGFTNIRVVRGGMVRWNERGLPIVNRVHQEEERCRP